MSTKCKFNKKGSFVMKEKLGCGAVVIKLWSKNQCKAVLRYVMKDEKVIWPAFGFTAVEFGRMHAEYNWESNAGNAPWEWE